MAGETGVEIYWSNPAFELWLLLHLREQEGYLTSAQALNALKDELRRAGRSDYDKRIDDGLFALLRSGRATAVSRAEALAHRHGTDGKLPPTIIPPQR